MKKDQWINEVLNSANHLERVDAPLFMSEKILSKIRSGELAENDSRDNPFFKWAFALSVVVLLGINAISITRIASPDQRSGPVEIIAEIDQTTAYNY